MATPDDAEIVRSVLRGERKDFGELVRRYLPAVHAVAYAHLANHADAEDAAQNTFVRAFVGLDTLRDPARFPQWLLRIARNQALNLMRSRRPSLPPAEVPAPANDVASAAERAELIALLESELHRMDVKSGEVLTLHYLAGKTTLQIAHSLEISQEAVKKRLQRARADLGERMLRVLQEDRGGASGRGQDEARVGKILGVVLSTNVLWVNAGAAAGTGGANAVLNAVPTAFLALLLMVVLAGGGLYVAQHFLRGWDDRGGSTRGAPAPESAMRPAPVVATSRSASTPDASSEAATELPEAPLEALMEEAAFVEDPPARGRVRVEVTHQDGRPAAGVRLELARQQEVLAARAWTPVREGVTDGNGRYSFHDLEYSTAIGVHYAAPVYQIIARTPHALALRSVRLSPQQPEEDILMELVGTGQISGVVVTAEGRPVPGAEVLPYFSGLEQRIRAQRWGVLSVVTTDTGGAFTMDGLWDSGGWQLAAHSPEHALAISELVPVGTRNLRIVLEEESEALSVRVVEDVEGARRPLPGVTVTVEDSRLRTHRREAVTDDTGIAHVVGLIPEGAYYVSAQVDPPLMVPEPQRHLRAEEVLTLVAYRRSAILGRVVDAAGRGVHGATVLLGGGDLSPGTPDPVSSGSDGQFRFDPLPPGEYGLRAFISPSLWESSLVGVTLAAGEQQTDVELVLQGKEIGVLLEGMVQDPRGLPAAGARIVAFDDGGHLAVAYSLEDGYFEMGLPAPALPYEVYVAATRPRFESETRGPITIGAGTPPRVTLRLRELRASLDGYVTFPDGTPAPDVQVVAVPEEHWDTTPSTNGSNQAGRFTLRHLRPGAYRLDLRPQQTWRRMNVAAPELRGVALVIVEDGAQHLADPLVYDAPAAQQALAAS